MSVPAAQPQMIGRYLLQGVLATGGMATVYLGRLRGSAGFARTVAIKRMHAHVATDPEFVAMFVDEARLAGHIRHPNVVPVTDALSVDGEVLLVMEYVQGETLAFLARPPRERMPAAIAASIVCDALNGLHAAHEARDEHGAPLAIVHRDVSPQNIIVGVDGVARVLDFGIAKATGRVQVTRDGQLKGKLAYMAPEQLDGRVTRATDIWAMGVVLWEAITGTRLFMGDNPGETVKKIQDPSSIAPPSAVDPALAPFDDVVKRALATAPLDRFPSALDMSIALSACAPKAAAHEVAAWLKVAAGDAIEARAELLSHVESGVSSERAIDQTDTSATATAPASAMTGEATELDRRPLRPRRAAVAIVALLAVVGAGAAIALTRGAIASSPPPRVSESASVAAASSSLPVPTAGPTRSVAAPVTSQAPSATAVPPPHRPPPSSKPTALQIL